MLSEQESDPIISIVEFYFENKFYGDLSAIGSEMVIIIPSWGRSWFTICSACSLQPHKHMPNMRPDRARTDI
jgi:hypothetical protein